MYSNRAFTDKRQRSGVLLKTVPTRWNSFFPVVERLCDIQEGIEKYSSECNAYADTDYESPPERSTTTKKKYIPEFDFEELGEFKKLSTVVSNGF